MQQNYVIGQKYENPDGSLYQVLCIAKKEDTGEELVIYQNLFGDFGIYAKNAKDEKNAENAMDEKDVKAPSTSSAISDKFMAFLDADDLQTRYNLLSQMQGEVTDTMIDSMAVVCDITVEDGPIDHRLDDLKHAIAMRQQYENAGRLRS